MDTDTDFDVIVIVRNRLDYTRRTINSLRNTTSVFNLFIVDNASDEEGANDFLLHQEEMGATIIRTTENLGWGAAVNLGLKSLTGSKHVLLLNNDVELLPHWYETSTTLLAKYPDIGVLALWKHINHGVLETRDDLIIKDQMPAVAWMFTKDRLAELAPFPVHGPCHTKGGNGEDVQFCTLAREKGYLVCAPTDDYAVHLDGY
jgi:glycosyltransferase involved in cell wall biosynthesis